MNHKTEWTLEKWQPPAPPDPLPPQLKNGHANGLHLIDARCKPEDFECVLLGSLGFKLRVIAERTGLSIFQVYNRLKHYGISVNHYRNGTGPMAQLVIETVDRRAAKQLSQQVL